ncbi:hypothetical protein PVS_14 [Vibrio phage vB_VspS_VS-ABTNL-3]|nr:hypothetical protein PVS_14 [Vibrio phage vB_VspS_VS-ABTNL-3]
MHGDWDDQTATWDSLTEEYKWDFNEYLDSVLFRNKSGVSSPTPPVIFRVARSLGSKSGMDSNSAGSFFRDSVSLGSKSKVAGVVNGIQGYESLRLSSKSSMDYKAYELYMQAEGSLGMRAGTLASPNTHVSLEHCFDLQSGFNGKPAGSTYHLESALKMRTRVVGTEETTFDLYGHLGTRAGLNKAAGLVNFDVEGKLHLQSSVVGLGSLILPKEVSLGMKTLVYGASGNTFFESCVFNGVISDSITTNYTARDVVYFVNSSGMDTSSHVDFSTEGLMEMGMSYTVRDGWWIRVTPGAQSDWNSDSTVDGNWSADSEGSSNGWTPDEF